MKKQKVCALLCVAAMTISSVTPAMAADVAVTPQEENVIIEEVEEATDPVAEDSQEAETTVDGTEEEQESAENTEEEPEISGEPQQDQEKPEADAESTQETTEQDVTESQETITNSDENTVVIDGWRYDGNGNAFYYKDGEKLVETIVEIKDKDGVAYGYYFDKDGVMKKRGYYLVRYKIAENEWAEGYIFADNAGHLMKGWYKKDTVHPEYFGEDYVAYQNKLLEDDGKLYYFDENGYRIKNRDVVVEGVLYKADDDGVLTEQEVAGKNGWELAGSVWYYYKDGKILKDTYATINGAQYYFESDGTMATGVFYDKELEAKRFAEPSGKIVNATGWYQSKETGNWYWFEKAGIVSAGTLQIINGKEFYFSDEGEMMTGTFQASYVDETGEWVTKTLYADCYGAISRTSGWKNDNGCWRYVDKNGEAVADGIVDINGKSYSFDEDGKMESGFIYPYITDSSGAIVKNQWVKGEVYWYFTDENGQIRTDEWIDGTYYLDDTGAMVTGSYTIDGKKYIFDEHGRKVEVIGEQNGWRLADGEWYYVENGEPYSGWLNHTYYLRKGKMVTENFVPAEHRDTNESAWSYVGVDGKVRTGWIYDEWYNEWYYAEKNSVTGDWVCVSDCWKKINGNWYYFNSENMVSSSIKKIDGKLSEFTASGSWKGYVTQSGWKQDALGNWYYVKEDGTLATGLQKINGKTYHFDSAGRMEKNCEFRENYDTRESLWFGADGAMDTTPGWKTDGSGHWYYVENGKLVSGKKIIKGVEYYFESGSYEMRQDGAFDDGKGYYICDKDGKSTSVAGFTGWYLNKELKGDVWYYFQGGKPYTGNIGRYVTDRGRMITGIYEGYMFDDNGLLVTNRWICRYNTWYYAGSTGKLYTGTRTVNGKTYLFAADGAWIK